MDIQLAAQEFYEHSHYIKGFSKETIRRYKQAINFYASFAFIKTLDQVSNTSLRDMFFKGRMERKWKPNTFIAYQKSLNVFFQWCMMKHYLQENPIAELESPRLERRLPTKLTRQDAFRLMEGVYNYPYKSNFIRCRNHAIFAMFIFAGLRKRELLNLNYTDVDLENRSVFVNQGKGNKDRIIPIPHALIVSLERYIGERKKLNITCAKFFAAAQGNQGISAITLRRMIDLMRKSCRIPFTAHKLRHTFATLMIEGGCDIYSLSKMMGHDDIKTTTLYLSASPDLLRSQMIKHPLNN